MTTLKELVDSGTWTKLSSKARSVMGVLLVNAVDGTCTLTKRKLMEMTDFSFNTVSAALDELIEMDLIVKVTVLEDNGSIVGSRITIK